MTFDDILDQVLALLRREGRVSYRALKLRFNLDDDYLEGLKDEIIEAKKLGADEGGRVFVQETAMARVDFHALCRLSLVEAQMLAGRLEEAYALAERTLMLARERQEHGHQAYALRLLGDIASRRDPPESALAEAHYQHALALADELGMRPLAAHCHLGRGTLYAATGQREQARSKLSAAIVLYRDMEMTFWLPQAKTALAQVEGR